MNLETEVGRELWQAVRRSYESQAWSNAILDSIHYLSDALRLKTGLQSDGAALVGQALGGKAPKLRLNRLQSESEKNVQAGVEQLLRGLYQAIRNPRSHERLEDTQGDADALIVFVDYLLKVIGHARAAFSIDECVGRIVEENFVPTERYANLLVEETPARQRLQVALSAYHRKREADASKLRHFFNAVIPRLGTEEARELFDAMSAELRETMDQAILRSVLQLLHPKYWLQIDEVARLRSENRLISSLQEGLYIRKSDKCLAGAVAAWSTSFWPHFTMKSQVLNVLIQKLRSGSVESQDYVLKYCFDYLDDLAEAPPRTLQWLLVERLNAGDTRFKEALDSSALWADQLWYDSVQKAVAEFQASEPVPEDDGIPF